MRSAYILGLALLLCSCNKIITETLPNGDIGKKKISGDKVSWTVYDDTTGNRMYTTNSKKGSFHGAQYDYYPSGHLRSRYHYHDGKTTRFYENGKKEEVGRYAKGEVDTVIINDNTIIPVDVMKDYYNEIAYPKRGAWKEFYPNGKIKSKKYYNGKFVLVVHVRGNTHGLEFLSIPKGVWKDYSENGKAKKSTNYTNDQFIDLDSLRTLQNIDQ